MYLALHYVDLVRSPVPCFFTTVFSYSRVPEAGSSQVQPLQGGNLLERKGGNSLMAMRCGDSPGT